MSHQLQETKGVYCFSVFRLDVTERCLWADDERISLTPKQFDLLAYFVEHARHVAKKSDLLDAVWADSFVEEATLARNISWLRSKLAEYTGGESFIETVSKLGYRFTAEVTRSADDKDALLSEEQPVQSIRDEETIRFDDGAIEENDKQEQGDEESGKTTLSTQSAPSRRHSLSIFVLPSIVIACVALAGSGYIFSRNSPKTDAQTPGLTVQATEQAINAGSTVAQSNLKIGSIVNLKNEYPGEGWYLDTRGQVKDKPQFSIVPTETLFVSTHTSPNRETGSGSWKIVSATGKKNGEPLAYGDKTHLQNMFPGAGYLDNCGWIKDMPMYEGYTGAKFAVFTTYSRNRDNGTGIWIVRSAKSEHDGLPVLEGDSIRLENGFLGGGYLDVNGLVTQNPAFNEYDGSQLLVFLSESPNRFKNSGNWTITSSKAWR